MANYVLYRNGSSYWATPGVGTGMADVRGDDFSTVLQGCVNALTVRGGRGSGGGHIYIARGVHHLSREITIAGWEGIAGTSGAPDSQLMITGDGYATQLVQNTAGQNGIVVKDLANFALRDLRMYSGVKAKSCLLGDSSGAGSEMSCWGSVIDNVSFTSNSRVAPAVLMKNFFSLHIPKASFSNPNHHAFMVVNDSRTTNYGNSHFGQIGCSASAAAPYAGLHFSTTTSGAWPNLISVDNYQCNGSHYGIYAKGLKFSTFSFADIEGAARPIYFDGGSDGFASETRHNKLLSGYLRTSGTGTAITCTKATGGNDFACVIDAPSPALVLADRQQYRPGNRYDVFIGDPAAVRRIKITDDTHTQIRAGLSDGTSFIRP